MSETIIMYDSKCLNQNCKTTGTTVIKPEYCIVCGGQTLKIKSKQISSEGWYGY
jgi:rRNA maturation endonuclease Nob1